MTIDELIERVKREVNERVALYNADAEELNKLRAADDVDEVRVDELRAHRAAVSAQIEERRERLAALQKEREQDAAVERAQRETAPVTQVRDIDRAAPVQVAGEPRTYARETDPQGLGFLSDVARDFLGDRGARERLSRHMEEERVERAGAVAR